MTRYALSVPTRNERQRSDITPEGQERLQQIVREAVRLFDRGGYYRVTMDDIAEAVSLRKPSLYHYVRNKEEILALVHHEFMELVFNRRAARGGPLRTARAEITETMTDILDLMRTHGSYVRVFFNHFRELPKRDKLIIKKERDRCEAAVREIFMEGIDSGELRAIDAKLATLALFGMCNWAYQWYDPRGSLKPRQIAEVFSGFLLDGIMHPSLGHADAPLGLVETTVRPRVRPSPSRAGRA